MSDDGVYTPEDEAGLESFSGSEYSEYTEEEEVSEHQEGSEEPCVPAVYRVFVHAGHGSSSPENRRPVFGRLR